MFCYVYMYLWSSGWLCLVDCLCCVTLFGLLVLLWSNYVIYYVVAQYNVGTSLPDHYTAIIGILNPVEWLCQLIIVYSLPFGVCCAYDYIVDMEMVLCGGSSCLFDVPWISIARNCCCMWSAEHILCKWHVCNV